MRILLYTLAFSLLYYSATAQSVMIGIQGGVMPVSAPLGVSKYYSNFDGDANMLLGARLGIDTRKLQVGLGCNISSVSHTRQSAGDRFYQSTTPVFRYEFSSGYVNPYLFVHFKKNLLRTFIYYGASIGTSRLGSGIEDTYFLHKTVDMPRYAGRRSTGFTLGLQAGARIKLLQGLGASAELAARYDSATPFMSIYDVNGQSLGTFDGNGMFTFPVTLGVDYIF